MYVCMCCKEGNLHASVRRKLTRRSAMPDFNVFFSILSYLMRTPVANQNLHGPNFACHTSMRGK